VPERGVVKWFSNTKGYGFITMENGQDAFAHYSDIAGAPGDYKTLEEGMTVEFDILSTERGAKAVNIVRTEDAQSPSGEESQALPDVHGESTAGEDSQPTY